jgi:hypothetical protein
MNPRSPLPVRRTSRVYDIVSTLAVCTMGLAVLFVAVTWDVKDWFEARRAAQTVALGALMTLGYARMRSEGSSLDEAYRFGYDLGYEAGHHAASAETEGQTVIRRLRGEAR